MTGQPENDSPRSSVHRRNGRIDHSLEMKGVTCLCPSASAMAAAGFEAFESALVLAVMGKLAAPADVSGCDS